MSINDALKTDIAHSRDLFRSPAGDIGTVSGLSNYKLALIHRLTTVPGSLVHRPTYGVGVGLWMNGLSSFARQQKLASVIVDQFKQDPRTQSVTRVAITPNEDNPQLTVIQVVVVPVGYSEQVIEYTPSNFGQVG